MPQMAPYNWLSMNFFFSLIFLIYLTYIYFLNYNIPNFSYLILKKHMYKFNW